MHIAAKMQYNTGKMVSDKLLEVYKAMRLCRRTLFSIVCKWFL